MSDAQLPMVDPFRPFPAVSGPNRTYSRRRIIRTALLKALDEDSGDGTRQIDRFARSMVSAAIDGDVDAAKFITDRVDGKQLAAAELADGEGSAPVDDGRMLRALALLVEEMRISQRPAIEHSE